MLSNIWMHFIEYAYEFSPYSNTNNVTCKIAVFGSENVHIHGSIFQQAEAGTDSDR